MMKLGCQCQVHCTKILHEFEFGGHRSKVNVTGDKKNEKLLSHPH